MINLREHFTATIILLDRLVSSTFLMKTYLPELPIDFNYATWFLLKSLTVLHAQNV